MAAEDQIDKELKEIHDAFASITYASELDEFLKNKLGPLLVEQLTVKEHNLGRIKNIEDYISVLSEVASKFNITLPMRTADLEWEEAVEKDRANRINKESVDG